MDSFAYPQRNLPGRAEDWGRAVEAQQGILSKEVRQVNQAWENSARATGGQLAVIASQIDTVTAQQDLLSATVEELDARRMIFTTAANLSVTGNATTTPFPSATRDFILDAPILGRRRGLFSASWTYSNSGGGSTIVSAFSEILQDSVVIWSSKGGVSVPYMASSPGTWPVSETVSLPVSVPAEGSLFQLRIHRVGSSTTTTTLTASGLSATLDYGDRY